MNATSFIRSAGLPALALLMLAGGAGPGVAGSNGNGITSLGETYGMPIIRHIPGLRLLFGEDTSNGDGSGQPTGKKKIDETYYEPQPAAPARPKPVKPAAKAATATPPATPAPATAIGNPALPQKTQTASAAKPPTAGPLTCDKATEVVSSYGFSSVEAASCTGRLYAFNARRGGRSFAIKLDSASGELTEVKKLP